MLDFIARDERHFVVQVLFAFFKIFVSAGTLCMVVVFPIIVVTDVAPSVVRNSKLSDSVAVLQVCIHLVWIHHLYLDYVLFFVQRR